MDSILLEHFQKVCFFLIDSFDPHIDCCFHLFFIFYTVRESPKLVLSVQSLIGKINLQPVECSDSRILRNILLEAQLPCLKKETVQDKRGNIFHRFYKPKIKSNICLHMMIIHNPSKTNYLSYKQEYSADESCYALRSNDSVRDYIPPESIQIVSIHVPISGYSAGKYYSNFTFIEEEEYFYPDDYKKFHPDVIEKNFLFGPRSFRDQNYYDLNPEIYEDQFVESLFDDPDCLT